MHRKGPTSYAPSRYFIGNKEYIQVIEFSKEHRLRKPEVELQQLQELDQNTKQVLSY